MLEIFWNGLVFGLFVAAPALFAWTGRKRGWLVLGVAAVAVVTAMVTGVLVPLDLVRLPVDTGLAVPLALMLGHAALGVAASAAGRPWLPGPPVLVAPLTGALLGEIGGAAVMAATTDDPKAKARLALAAAAGGLLGRMGDPGLLIVGTDELTVARLAPLALVALLAARPKAGDLAGAAEGSKLITGIAFGAALLAFVPMIRVVAVWGGALALAGVAGKRLLQARTAPLTWAIGSTALVLVATAAGAPALVGIGLEEIQNAHQAWVPAMLVGGGALVSALAGGHAAAVMAQAVLDRALSLHISGAATALTVGVAVGGLGPLLAAGAVRAGFLRWLLQVALVGAVALWLLG